MELPQPRPLRTEAKTATHDFLSLYAHSSFSHQDPRPSSQGSYLKTHDFLQPLERVGKNSSKGENMSIENPLPSSSSSSAERVLPGGIGTYSIGHISNISPRVLKPERTQYTVNRASSTERNGDVSKSNSNCSSYSGGGFTLWEECLKDKGTTTGKDNTRERQIIKEPAKLGQWSSERPLRNSFSSLTSSNKSPQQNQNFLEIMKSVKDYQEEEVDDGEDFGPKKEDISQGGMSPEHLEKSVKLSSSIAREFTAKGDGQGTDQKIVTPRSKHSATEQRRRSKINDRFQILRDLIPHSDQKRDKASFLLEVIEYIQFLQEKVQKYEGSYQGWSNQPTKLMPWRNSHGPIESFIDHSEGVKNGCSPGLMLGGKIDEDNFTLTPTVLSDAQNPVEPDSSTAAAYKTVDHPPHLVNKATPMSMPLQPNTFTPIVRSDVLSQPFQRSGSDVDNMESQPQSQLLQNRTWKTECPAKSRELNGNEELPIEGGTINISTAYSQGLLMTLTQALQNSGIDLSQASISVQIDIGKRANSRLTTVASSFKEQVDPSSSNRAMACSQVASSGEDSDQARKRLKTEKS